MEKVLRDAVEPARSLAAAIEDGLRGYLAHAVADDGLRLMQYEFTIFCRRTEGCEWLAEWQYARYASAALEVFQDAASFETRPLDISMTDRTNFLVAAMDGPVIQFEVTHDSERCQRDLEHVVRAAILLAGLPAGDTRVAPLGHGRTG